MIDQCRLSRLQFLFQWTDGFNWHTDFESDFKDCIAKGRAPHPCFSYAAEAAEARRAAAYASLGPDDRRVGDTFARDAIMALLLHEFAHIASGHLERNEKPRDELEADTFSLFFGNVAGAIPQTAVDIFSGYTILDPFLKDKRGRHGSFFCRFMTSWFISRELGFTPTILLGLVGAGRMPRESALTSLQTDLADPPESMEGLRAFRLVCPVVLQDELKTVPADISLIAPLIQKRRSEIDAIEAGGDPTLLIEAIVALQLKSVEGRSLASRIAATLLNHSTRRWTRERWRTGAGGRLADKILSFDRRRDVAGEAHGVLLALKAMSDYFTISDTVARERQAAEFIPRFEEALYYNERLPEMYLLAGLLKIQVGNCTDGLALYAQGIARAPENRRASLGEILEGLRTAAQTRGCDSLREVVPYASGRKGLGE
jgi:hypothetical protein